MDNLDIITIKAPKQIPKNFPREGQGLRLSTLKRYYAAAVGLTYELNNIPISASIDETEIIIPKDVSECTVDYPEVSQNEASEIVRKDLNEKKRSRVSEIIAKYDGVTKKKDMGSVECLTKQRKVTKIAKVERKTFKVTWQHWRYGQDKPKTVSGPYASEHTMELYTDISYSFKTMKNKCVSLFPRITMDEEVKECLVQLAVPPGSKVIDNFYDEDNKACDLWKAKNIKDSARRLHFYVITTETKVKEKDSSTDMSHNFPSLHHNDRNDYTKNDYTQRIPSLPKPINERTCNEKPSSFLNKVGITTELKKNCPLDDVTNYEVSPPKRTVSNSQFLKDHPPVEFVVPAVPEKRKKMDKFSIPSVVKTSLNEKAATISVHDNKKKDVKIENVGDMKMQVVDVVPYKNLNVKTEHKLGEGAFGTVYKGEWLKEEIAVKSLHSVSKHGKGRDTLILREVSVLAQLSHKNLISIRAVSITESQPRFHIAMEFFESKSLYSLIHSNEMQNSKLKLEDKHFMAYQICQAIYYLHNNPRQIIHKDIKPSNILVNSNYEVKVCDFGLSTSIALETALQSTHEKKGEGTPCYMAPEVFTETESPSMSSDVWSLTCTLIELYRCKPIWGDNVTYTTIALKFIKKELPDLTGVPASLVRPYLEKCLSYEPRERLPVGVLTDELTKLRGQVVEEKFL